MTQERGQIEFIITRAPAVEGFRAQGGEMHTPPAAAEGVQIARFARGGAVSASQRRWPARCYSL